MILIRELGDEPVKHTRPKRNAYGRVASHFEVGNVEYIFVAEEKTVGWEKNELKKLFKKWDLVSSLWEIRFSGDGAYSVTGSGNAAIVFSTLKKIIGNFLNIYKPEYWYFDANKETPSREKLYNLFAKIISRVYPQYQLLQDVNPKNDSMHYYLFKRK